MNLFKALRIVPEPVNTIPVSIIIIVVKLIVYLNIKVMLSFDFLFWTRRELKNKVVHPLFRGQLENYYGSFRNK